MEHVHKCTSVLRPLISAGDTNGIPLAERAIGEMLATTRADQHRASLDSVRSAVEDHRATASGSQLWLADTINDYIQKLMRGME
jgi:hypothetical protein